MPRRKDMKAMLWRYIASLRKLAESATAPIPPTDNRMILLTKSDYEWLLKEAADGHKLMVTPVGPRDAHLTKFKIGEPSHDILAAMDATADGVDDDLDP